ncbi:hypothetical protein BDN70DRAFT_783329, partial [Pholiota conissans]
DLPFPENDHWTYPVEFEKPLEPPSEEWERKSHLLIALDKDLTKQFVEGYKEDPFFKEKYTQEIPNDKMVITPSHFRVGSDQLLYFLDADWATRLCVPRSLINFVLKWIHDSAFESAHAG